MGDGIAGGVRRVYLFGPAGAKVFMFLNDVVLGIIDAAGSVFRWELLGT